MMGSCEKSELGVWAWTRSIWEVDSSDWGGLSDICANSAGFMNYMKPRL